MIAVVELPDLLDVNPAGCMLGLRARTLDELMDLYYDHAKAIGFDVRKSTQRRTSEGEICEKYLLCYKEGTSKPKTPKSEPEKKKQKKESLDTRTNCQASIRIKLNKDNVFEVMHHNTEHNHEFTRKQWHYMHRSERRISAEKGRVIQSIERSGIKPAAGFKYLACDAKGEKNVGHNKRDHINYVNRMRMQDVEGGDANAAVKDLCALQDEQDDFFFRVRWDENNKLSALFWRDSLMLEDYSLYGDLVIFDTTYRTNRYNLVCAPFVGLNNHKHNVMFACAFIADEKKSTFTWLLETFKKSMKQKVPETIFTDQDKGMMGAIKKVLYCFLYCFIDLSLHVLDL